MTEYDAPVSGAHHFDYDEAGGCWLDTRAKEGEEAGMLEDILVREIGPVVGTIPGLEG